MQIAPPFVTLITITSNQSQQFRLLLIINVCASVCISNTSNFDIGLKTITTGRRIISPRPISHVGPGWLIWPKFDPTMT